MTESELEYEISRLESELDRMTQTYTYKDYEVKNLDVYTHEIKRTVGTKDEIARTKALIAEYKNELENVRQHKNENKESIRRTLELKEKYEKQQAIEKQRREEFDKQQFKIAFGKVKNRYKQQDLWTRVTNVVNHRTPNWKRIKEKYTQEELDFLYNVSIGNTAQRKAQYDEALKRRLGKPSAERESMRKFKKNQKLCHLAEMTKLLNNQSLLDSKMQLEEKGRAY